MIDRDLIEEIESAFGQSGLIGVLQPDTLSNLIDRIADLYVQDRSYLRWWESLKAPVERIAYGNDDGLSKLADLVEQQDDVVLIVTDEEAEPWLGYAGPGAEIVKGLRSCRYFEFMLAARDGSWVLFDTHTNEILRVGQSPG